MSKRISDDDSFKRKKRFIKRARQAHRDKYDYSKVEYKRGKDKIIIICPEHGEFLQSPENHIYGCRCPKCAKEINAEKKRIKYRKKFIEKAKEIHGDKYDYSKVEYKTVQDKVIIICPEHGEFLQAPNSHTSSTTKIGGCGCPDCGGRTKITTEEFIKRAKKVHGDKYDYSKVEYKRGKDKIIIICPEHGEFLQSAGIHYLTNSGCPDCFGNVKLTTEKFIERARQIHEDKYDYSKVEYINMHTKVIIICPEHGEFLQSPTKHIRGNMRGGKYSRGNGCSEGNGCSKCSGKQKLTTEEFIKRAKKVHGDKYDYSKVEYERLTKKVIIICPEHGEFLQSAGNHLSGSREGSRVAGNGCPDCSWGKSERETFELLNKYFPDWEITRQKKIWSKYRHYHHRRLCDFWLNKDGVKMMVEYDGEQHFRPVCFNGMSLKKAEYKFKKTKLKDKLDAQFCKEHGIILHRIKYDEDIEESIKSFFNSFQSANFFI